MLWFCKVLRIDGDYAILVREDDETGETFQVARALLPDETDAGMRLKCENFVYEII